MSSLSLQVFLRVYSLQAPYHFSKATSLPLLHGCSPNQHPILLSCLPCLSPQGPPFRNRPPNKEHQVVFIRQPAPRCVGACLTSMSSLSLILPAIQGTAKGVEAVRGGSGVGWDGVQPRSVFLRWFWVSRPDWNAIITKPITYFKIFGSIFSSTVLYLQGLNRNQQCAQTSCKMYRFVPNWKGVT